MLTTPDVIAVDVGATTTRLGVVSAGGALSSNVRFSTPNRREQPSATLADLQSFLFDRIVEHVRALRAEDSRLMLSPVAVSFGAVISNEGVVANASVLWHEPASGFDIVGALKDRLGSDELILAVNDVSAAAWRYRDEGRFALITVSTGIGCKVFDERLATPWKLELDDAGLGGEMGHVLVEASGEVSGSLPPCPCGNNGDLCSYASGPAVERMARSLARDEHGEFERSHLAALVARDPDAVDTFAIARAAAEGDTFADRILELATRHLALRILQLAADLGLDKFIVTGGFANGVGDPYFTMLYRNLRRLAHDSGFFSGWDEARLQSLIRRAPDHADDSLIGVAMLVQERARAYRAAYKPVGRAALELRTRRREQCGAEQVVSRILYAGICSTDLQIYRGDRTDEPGILGHECVAQALEVGALIPQLRPGDLFGINPNNPLDGYDKIGHTREGVFQELFTFNADLVAKGQITALSGMPRPEWVLLELLACVVRAHEPISEWYRGRTVLVAGAGVTGIMHALVARERGAAHVVVANRSATKLEFAVARGIVSAEDAYQLDVGTAAAVRQATGGGADVGIVACAGRGGPEVTALMLDGMADDAIIVLFGGFMGGALVRAGNTSVDCTRLREGGLSQTVRAPGGRRITFVGSRGSRPGDYEEARDLCAEGKIDLSALVTTVISLAELPSAVGELARTGRLRGELAMRVVVDMTARRAL